MALRFTRGLFRLWLVLSVLWVGGVAIATWLTLPADEDINPPPPGYVIDNPPPPAFDPDAYLKGQPQPNSSDGAKPAFDPTKPYQVLRDKERLAAIKSAVLLAALPPAFMLAFGSALIWAFRGFRP